MTWWAKRRSGRHFLLGVAIFGAVLNLGLVAAEPQPFGIPAEIGLLVFGALGIVGLYRLVKEYRTPPS